MYWQRRRGLGSVCGLLAISSPVFNIPSEVALKYPRSKVVILDKEPYSRYLPPNCTTEAGDIAEYPRNFFWDYVYVRNLRGIGDCGAYFDRLRGIVRSEGHIELVDIDDAYDVVCTCSQLGDWVKISTPGWTSKSINAFKLGHASRCQICASFPTARRRRDLLRQSGFCKLTITYHARPGLTMHRAKISRQVDLFLFTPDRAR